jgi:hypothetical protein
MCASQLKLLALAALALTAGAVLRPRTADPLPGFPRVFVWAWERPENLESLGPRAAGVAFLARTVFLRDGAVFVKPRLQPLRYHPEAVLMAVVRVESAGHLPEVDKTAEAIAAASRYLHVRALQVDFDARKSERDFYRSVLIEVRRRMPEGMPLSMTALASWCESDRWMSGLPVDEAVPMLFQMGTNEPLRGTNEPLCRSSAGVATDEPFETPPRGRRIYVFHPRAWSNEELHAAVREVSRWQ